ncbi:MAG: CHASE2 domain-containing protein [Novosphingobium sp.]
MSRTRLFLEWLAILAASCLIAWWAGTSGATNRLDLQLLDLASSRRAAPATEDIILVAIDDRSLAAEGQWPWDRRRMAQLVDRLSDDGARAIVLDVLFIEPGTPEGDAALADAVARSGRVALAQGFVAAENRTSGIDPLPPIEVLSSHAIAVGHVVIAPDADGTVRRVPLVVQDGATRYDHLQVEAFRALNRRNPADYARALHDNEPPVLPLRPEGAYRTVPASAVLAGEVPADYLRGKIVMVGATAAGLGDRHPVPHRAGSTMAGVELQANLYQALGDGSFIRPVPAGMALWLSLAPIFVLFVGFWRLRPAQALMLSLLLAGIWLAGSVVLAIGMGWWLAPGPAILAILAAYPLWGWRRLAAVSDFLEAEARRLAPTAEQGERPSLGGFDNVAKQVSRLHYLVDAMAERRAFLTAVIEAAPDAICVFDSDGGLVLTNERARGLFKDVAEGTAFNDLVLAAGGRMDAGGREMTLPDGSVHAVAASRSHEDAAWSGLQVVAFGDVTEMRRAEADRRHMLEFLSHDMRSPQVAILGLAGGRVGATGEGERLARIAGHARRTLKLADDFVHLSRIAETALDPQELDMGMLVEEAVDRAWFAAREHRIRLRVQLPDGPVYFHGDGHVLSRVLDNLIGNAIKYAPAGTDVTVTLIASDDAIRLLVADQGPGLPPERRADPFRRFGERRAGGGAQDTLGAGLGLAFVVAAVDKHGATIACETGEGCGTCFTITFPKPAE